MLILVLGISILLGNTMQASAETAAEAGARIARERGMTGQTARCFVEVFAQHSVQDGDGTWKPVVNPRRGVNVTREEFNRRCKPQRTN